MKKTMSHVSESIFKILVNVFITSFLSITLFACGAGSGPVQISSTPSASSSESAALGSAQTPSEPSASSSESVPSASDDSEKSWPFNVEIDWADGAGISTMSEEGKISYRDADGRISFMTGDFSGKTVRNQEDAQRMAGDFVKQNNALEGSVVSFSRSDTFHGVSIYTFLQQLDGITLEQGVVKIIVNKDCVPIAIANSFLTDYDTDLTEAQEREPQADLDKRFKGFESGTYETTIKTLPEESLSISVPVVKDPATGNQYLADLKRKLICVEIPEDDKEQIDSADDLGATCLQASKNIESKLVTYSYMLKVYDYFAAKGWSAPDGLGTPCQLIFDDSGKSDGNASYNGLGGGYQAFCFGVNDEASQSIQVIAHEFMHGVSRTNHIGDYANETGALDEAMSDIIGNAVESDILDIDKEHNGWFSYFHEMHTSNRPLYVWDEYYLPPASIRR